jgi:hypothetical protein
MSLLSSLAACLCGGAPDDFQNYGSSNHINVNDSNVAQEIIDLLYNTEKSGQELQTQLKNIVTTNGWTENLAKAILSSLELAIKTGHTMSLPMGEAYNKAVETANSVGNFAKDHPVFCTLIALGILVLLMPWVIEALGFAAEGPVAGIISTQSFQSIQTNY